MRFARSSWAARKSARPTNARPCLERLEDRCLMNVTPLNLIVSPPNAIEGQPTGPITVATIQDSNTNAQAADLTATIDWGDHTPGATVTGASGGIVQQADGSFTVTVAAGHTYADEGHFGLTVAVSDTAGNANSVTADANVADAALSPFMVRNVFAGSSPAAAAGTFTVATFSDTNPLGTAADFTAVINWGDGQTTTATAVNGGIISTGTSNLQPTFAVMAAHSYGVPTAGLHLSVQLSDVGGFNLQGNATLSASGNSGGGGGAGGGGSGGVVGGGGGSGSTSPSAPANPGAFTFVPASIHSIYDLVRLLPGDLNSTLMQAWMDAQLLAPGGPFAGKIELFGNLEKALLAQLTVQDPADTQQLLQDEWGLVTALFDANETVIADPGSQQANSDASVSNLSQSILANPLYQTPQGKAFFLLTGTLIVEQTEMMRFNFGLLTYFQGNTGVRFETDFAPWTQLALAKGIEAGLKPGAPNPFLGQ